MRTPLDETTKILAVEMSIITGEIWRAEFDDNYRYPQIFSPSAYLYLMETYPRGRMEIRASAPRKMREKRTPEKITVDPNRTPEAIAQDITRRLLPHARAHLLESIKYHNEKEKEEATKKLTDRYLQKELPHEWRNHNNTVNFTNEYDKEPDAPPITARRYYDGTIEINTRLPIREALKIIRHLKGL